MIDDPNVNLMVALAHGDRRGFDRLYERWRTPVFRFALRMIGHGSAEEVTQEAFVRVYRARDRYRPEAPFRSWLFQIVAHLCINERRRASVRLEVVGQDPPEPVTGVDHDPGRALEGRRLSDAVEAAIASLPERQRAAVLLARYEGCSMAEIGEVLEDSPGAAKLLLHRAREALRRDLARFLPAEEAG